MFFKGYFERRKQAALKRARQNGFDYAAGALLRGEKTTQELTDQAMTADTWGESNYHKEFDLGILDAIDRCVALDCSIPDDRHDLHLR